LRRSTVAISILALVTTGCGGVEDSTPSEETAPLESQSGEGSNDAQASSDACGTAVEAAAAVDAMEDAVDDLDPAIAACADLEEFEAATADHPDALDGADATTFVSNRCLYSEAAAVTRLRSVPRYLDLDAAPR
jgi:hypothetical protein